MSKKTQLWVRLEFQLLFFPKIHTILKPPVCTTGFSKAENHNGLKKVNRISLTQRHPSSLQTPWVTWAKKKRKRKKGRAGMQDSFYQKRQEAGWESLTLPQTHTTKRPQECLSWLCHRGGAMWPAQLWLTSSCHSYTDFDYQWTKRLLSLTV